jgi:hypothetical protein
MKPKTINLLYWIFTILFAGLMLLSALGGLQPSADSIKMVHDQMGYPVYFIQFISVAKVLGAAAILIPGFNRIKEWAYAGLFFDLVGATYSAIMIAEKFDPKMLGVLVFFILGILSYYYWRKKQSAHA